MFKYSSAFALFTIVMGTGCQQPSDAGAEEPMQLGETAPAQPTETAVEKYGLTWLKADDGANDGSITIRADLFIDAPADIVWGLMRDPNGYGNFNKALSAQVEKMEVGQPIKLSIRLFGDKLPPTNSAETVAIFDETLHVASWDRDFGFGQVTHRPQMIEPEGKGVHYYTALKLPKALSWIVANTVGSRIKAAFEEFGAGLRDEALRRKAAGTP